MNEMMDQELDQMLADFDRDMAEQKLAALYVQRQQPGPLDGGLGMALVVATSPAGFLAFAYMCLVLGAAVHSDWGFIAWSLPITLPYWLLAGFVTWFTYRGELERERVSKSIRILEAQVQS